MSINLQLLQKKWVHAHEEDTPELMVFRPEDYPLGLSRGRSALEFHNNGTVEHTGIAPDDRLSFSEGNWRLLDDGQTVTIDEQAHASRVLKIVELDSDRLVIQK